MLEQQTLLLRKTQESKMLVLQTLVLQTLVLQTLELKMNRSSHRSKRVRLRSPSLLRRALLRYRGQDGLGFRRVHFEPLARCPNQVGRRC